MYEDDGAEEEKEMAFMPLKIEQKGKLSMDSMVESPWKPKDCSTLIEESISLVGKSTNMKGVTSGGFAPQAARVGQMKLEAPPRHSSKRDPRVRV